MASSLDDWRSPDPSLLPSVDERLRSIIEHIKTDRALNDATLPGLARLLEDYLDRGSEMSHTSLIRRLLIVFRKSTDQTYEHVLSRYEKYEQALVEKFVKGSTPIRMVAKRYSVGPSLPTREALQSIQEGTRSKLQSPGEASQSPGAGVSPSIGESSIAPPVEHDRNDAMAPVCDMDGVVPLAENDALIQVRIAGLYEDTYKSEPVVAYRDAPFQNWGLTVKNKPRFTCVPETKSGVKTIIKYASANNMGVRVSGYRHSWSPLFNREGNNGDILISMLPIGTATELPNLTSLPEQRWQAKDTELNSIVLLPQERPNGKRLVRVGCATTNEQLRRWCKSIRLVTIPFNVIMVEITMGGSNAPICHGAGRKNRTLSDLVKRIEYIDVHGEEHTIEESDSEFLRAASGCFGLIGVITHLTMEFDPMTCAVMRPQKVKVLEAIPPPPGMKDDDIPQSLRPAEPYTQAQKDRFQADFEARANDDYYAEWFWFPYSQEVWINTWNNSSEPEDIAEADDYPSKKRTFLEVISTITMQVLQQTAIFTNSSQLMPFTRTTLISLAAMSSLRDIKDDEKPIKTWLPDAIHFQRGIQNVRVRDIEVEMPLQPRQDNPEKVDYTLVQRAWWDGIILAYKHSHHCPMRMPLEMRIMGDSDVIMAPQRGNSLGTCSIEVLTLGEVGPRWEAFAQEMLDTWLSYTDVNGKKLRTRPHWAKEWASFTVDGMSWPEKLRTETYKEEIAEFKRVLSKIGKAHGWTLADIKQRFSNDLLDKLFLDDVEVPATAKSLEKTGEVTDVRIVKDAVGFEITIPPVVAKVIGLAELQREPVACN